MNQKDILSFAETLTNDKDLLSVLASVTTLMQEPIRTIEFDRKQNEIFIMFKGRMRSVTDIYQDYLEQDGSLPVIEAMHAVNPDLKNIYA